MELPRAVPLVYYLDENLRPVDLAGSAPYLRGEYVGDPEEVSRRWRRGGSVVAYLILSLPLRNGGRGVMLCCICCGF